MPSLLSRLAPKPFRESVHVALHKMAGLWFDSACRGGRRLRSRVCPVEEKAKIEICESDQRVADFNSANFGLVVPHTQLSDIRVVPDCSADRMAAVRRAGAGGG